MAVSSRMRPTYDPRMRPAYYPAMLDLAGRDPLLVGGGEIAAQKARPLLDAGVHPRIVAPALIAPLRASVEARGGGGARGRGGRGGGRAGGGGGGAGRGAGRGGGGGGGPPRQFGALCAESRQGVAAVTEIVVAGLSFHTAPLAVRERAAVAESE